MQHTEIRVLIADRAQNHPPTINIGIITGEYEYDSDAPEHRHRRRIAWKKIGLSRTVFPQPALYELGAFLPVFRLRQHAGEFQARPGSGGAAGGGRCRLGEAV